MQYSSFVTSKLRWIPWIVFVDWLVWISLNKCCKFPKHNIINDIWHQWIVASCWGRQYRTNTFSSEKLLNVKHLSMMLYYVRQHFCMYIWYTHVIISLICIYRLVISSVLTLIILNINFRYEWIINLSFLEVQI